LKQIKTTLLRFNEIDYDPERKKVEFDGKLNLGVDEKNCSVLSIFSALFFFSLRRGNRRSGKEGFN
jgi:hypothetical protein